LIGAEIDTGEAEKLLEGGNPLLAEEVPLKDEFEEGDLLK